MILMDSVHVSTAAAAAGAGRLPSEKVLWGNIPGLPTVDDDDDGARRLPLGGDPCGNIPGLPAEFPIPGLATSTLARLPSRGLATLTCAQSRAEP